MHASDSWASCAISSNFVSEVEELGASQRKPRTATSRTGVKDGVCVHHLEPPGPVLTSPPSHRLLICLIWLGFTHCHSA